MQKKVEMEQINNSRLINFTFTLASIVLVGFILSYTQQVLVPFVLALILAYVVIPFSNKLCGLFKLHPIIGIFLSYVVILGAIFIIIAFSSTPLIDLVSNSKSYLDKANIVVQPILLEVQSYGVPPISFANDVDFNPQKTIQTMLGIGMQFIVVILFSVFIVAGHEKQKLTHPILDQIDDELQKFISTKILISLILGALVTGVLWLLGVKWAFAFGLLSFILNFIPSIGPIVAALLPVPIVLVEISPMMSLAVFGVMILIMGIIGFIIEVKLMGDMLKLHPLVVLMSLIFWGVLWGAAGVFLAIPMTVMIKIILAHYPNTKAMARLLAGHLPK